MYVFMFFMMRTTDIKVKFLAEQVKTFAFYHQCDDWEARLTDSKYSRGEKNILLSAATIIKIFLQTIKQIDTCGNFKCVTIQIVKLQNGANGPLPICLSDYLFLGVDAY